MVALPTHGAYAALGPAIASERADIATRIVEEHWTRHPEFVGRYGATGRIRCVEDVTYNLSYLSSAISAESPALFASYVEWVKELFLGLDIPNDELAESLTITGNLLQQRFAEHAPVIERFISLGLHQLAISSKGIPSSFNETQPLVTMAHRYLSLLRDGERSSASRLVLDAVADGVSVKDIYLQVFEPSQHELGRLWQMNEMSVAQEHYCTAVTQLIMSQLYSHIFDTPKNGRRLVATCVGTELHEIGLRMVADFFEMDGWDTYYLGSRTPPGSVVEALTERNADVLAISATMTYHIELVAELIEQVRTGIPDRRVAILVGGYPFNVEPELWRRVGADGYAADAAEAIAVANALVLAQVAA